MNSSAHFGTVDQEKHDIVQRGDTETAHPKTERMATDVTGSTVSSNLRSVAYGANWLGVLHAIHLSSGIDEHARLVAIALRRLSDADNPTKPNDIR